MTELNDELLVAYVDGQLAKDQSKAIERVLEEDQVAAQRVHDLRAAHAHLETAFDAMMAGETLPPPVVPALAADEPVRKRRTVGSILRRTVAFAWVGFGCLLGGAAGGFILYDLIAAVPYQTVIVAPPEVPKVAEPVPAATAEPATPPTWEQDIAHAHTMLSRDTFSISLLGEGNPDLVGFKIANVFGTEFRIPDLRTVDLVFQRAQMLQREGVPFAQVAYLPETGAPLALYARAHKGETQPIRILDKDDLSLATWSHGGLSLLLAGQLPEDRLRAIAHVINEQLADAEPASGDTGTPTPPVSNPSPVDLREHVIQSPDE